MSATRPRQIIHQKRYVMRISHYNMLQTNEHKYHFIIVVCLYLNLAVTLNTQLICILSLRARSLHIYAKLLLP